MSHNTLEVATRFRARFVGAYYLLTILIGGFVLFFIGQVIEQSRHRNIEDSRDDVGRERQPSMLRAVPSSTLSPVRMLRRNGVAGTQRIARHLWRMCFGLFIASSSLFLARQQLFPGLLRKTGTLVLLSFLPLILMIYWLIRGRFADALKRKVIRLKHA